MPIPPDESKRGFLWWPVLALAAVAMPAGAADQAPGHLQDLLYGEALFHSYQQDYLSAITRLQLAEEQSPLPRASVDARLLLARMKLAYGLYLDAGFDFHALLGKDVPDEVRNRAWYELAETFSDKGYYTAAAEALAQVRGTVPADIAGDCQLLRATVLMSLEQNLQAAEVLEDWQGDPALSAYAYYNRGIALVRAGRHVQAVTALEMAVNMPAEGDELLALRDKARLSLGYALARLEEYEQAREQLEAVSPDSPFSNRALLALGWIAHKQGRSESALVSWMQLRGRSPTDPAVLETLLVLPAVQRELDEVQAATRDYEVALRTYDSELNNVQDAKEAVRNGALVSMLLQTDAGPEQGASGRPASGSTRYFGTLLASKDFQEMLQGHGDLLSMLHNIDKGLQDIDMLAKDAGPAAGAAADAAAMPPARPDSGASAGPTTGNGPPDPQDWNRAGPAGEPDWQQQWAYREGQPTETPAAEIPLLPEIELPDERTLKSLPEPEFKGLPEPDFTGLPGDPEYLAGLPDPVAFGLPESEIRWLPETGRFRIPRAGVEDYAYPDMPRKKRIQPGERYAYQLNRLIPSPGSDAGFDPGAVPVGEALRELAAALNSATSRMARLGDAFDPATGSVDLAARIAALRARILQLRTRIENAIALYESYTEALVLDELDRREGLLEDLREQASLELAKTYDRASDR